MLHGTICNGDFLRNTALQCWNNVATIWINVATILQRCIAHPLVDRYTKKIRAWWESRIFPSTYGKASVNFLWRALDCSHQCLLPLLLMFLSQTPKAMPSAVPNPDLEIKGGAPLSRLLDKKGKGVGRTPEELFSALRASKWRGGSGPPGPLPWIPHWSAVQII